MISSTSPHGAIGAEMAPATPRPRVVSRVWTHLSRVGEARARRELVSLGYGYLLDDSRLVARRDR